MIVDTQYLTASKKLVVSYIDDNGDIKLNYYDWLNPYVYEVCSDFDRDKEINLKCWNDKPIKKVYKDRPDRYSTYDFIDSLPQSELDVIYKYNLPNVYFIDIETEILDSFPEPSLAEAKVLTISIVFKDKVLLLGIGDISSSEEQIISDKINNYVEEFGTKYSVKYIQFKDEFELLWSFFNKYAPKMTLITGWNVINFDWRYLHNRARKLTKTVNNKVYKINVAESSPTKHMNNVFGAKEETVLASHKAIFDYMQLYEKIDTSVKVKESSSLDWVSNKLLGKNKVKFSGNLMDLHRDDYVEYLFYNAIDSILVQKIHEKMNYMEVLYAISKSASIKLVDTFSFVNNNVGTLAITEGVLRHRFKKLGKMLIRDKTMSKERTEDLAGGYVIDPIVSINRFVAILDFASLYPSIQRQWFISPENYLGIIYPNDRNYYVCYVTGEKIKVTNNLVVCVNDRVFKKERVPFLEMLEDIYAERNVYKNAYKKGKLELIDINEEEKILIDLLNEFNI